MYSLVEPIRCHFDRNLAPNVKKNTFIEQTYSTHFQCLERNREMIINGKVLLCHTLHFNSFNLFCF